MKKSLVIGAILLSAGSFAIGTLTGNSLSHTNGQGRRSKNERQEKKANEQNGRLEMTKQLETLSAEDKITFEALHTAHKESMKESRTVQKEIGLKIRKEFKSETPNQEMINGLIDEKTALQGEKTKEVLNFKLDVKEKFDIEMKGNKHRNKMMSKSNNKKSKGNKNSEKRG